MIAVWIAYASIIGVLAGLAAIASERAARLWYAPARWIWMLTIAASLAVPLAVAVAPRSPTELTTSSIARVGTVKPVSSEIQPTAADRGGATLMMLLRRLDRPLSVLWPLASLVLLATFARSAITVRRARRSWQAGVLDELPILITPDVGPAVVGFVRPAIVLPEWTLGMEHTSAELMLRHELEHIRARDPLTVLIAMSALVIAPWNLALWWQVRRLRFAIEVDCDRRVLRAMGAFASARDYAALLVDVGERASGVFGRHSWSPAFSESPSSLERRIVAMSETSSRHRVMRAAAFATGIAVIVAVACEAPRPDPIAPREGRIIEQKAALESMTSREQEARTRGYVMRYYPEIAQGDTTSRPMMFVVNSDHLVVATARGPAVAKAAFRISAEQPVADSAARAARLSRGEGAFKRTESSAAHDEPSLVGSLDKQSIESVQVRKFKAGEVGPDAAAAIVITLKPGARFPVVQPAAQ